MTTRDRERHTSAADTALFRYGTTVAAVASAGLARWLFDPLLGDNIPYATFFAAVALAAWVGGLRTGLLATGLGGVLALYAIVPPRLSFALPTGPHAVGLVMYLAVGLAISGFGEAMRVARRREAEHGERLRTTLSSIGDGVITTDTAGRVTNLNPVAEGLTGWTTVEATGQPLDVVFNIFNETTRQPVANPAFRALKEGVIVGLANHTILIARDGTERPIDDSAAPIRGRAGEVVGCVLVFRDVTDRRQAEVEQETARRQVETTLESITDGFMRFDRDWRVVYMNAEAERICQRPRSEVISQSHWEAFPATLGTRLEAEYRRAVADRVTVEFENFYEPWGRWFSIKGFPTPDGGLAVYFQDITARKRIEEELRHQTVMLRGVTDTTTDLIFVKDRDCRLTFANPACLTVLGMTERQALGVDPRTLYADPAEGEAIRATDERIMASGEDETVEEEYTGPLGTRTYSSKKTPLRDGTGAVVGVIGISRDITDRKGAEADLARERERLGLALHTGGLGVYEWRIGSDEVWWSPETFPVFGVDPATFRPTLEAFTALVHPDDRDALWRKTRECVERREVFDHEYRVVRPDGEVRWVYNRSHVAPGPGGEAGRITGVATDITDRKRAEERLRERERFVQRVLDASPGVVYVFDLARGGTAFINDRVRHALGVTPDEVIAAAGGFMAERVHPDDRDALAAHLAGLTGLADGAVCEVEYRMRHADGRWVWFLSRDTVFQRSPDGTPRQVLGVASDITARRRAEEESQASEERLRLAVEAGGMRTWDADLRAGRTVWSASHFALLGLPPHPSGEATYQMWLDRSHPDDRAAVEAAVEAARRDRGAFALEHRIVRADDGRVRWMAPSGRFHYAPGGEAVRFVGVEFDITARKEVEAVRRASEDRQAFLVALADALRPLSDPAAVRAAATRVLGRRLAVAHAYYADIEADGETIVVAADYADGVPSVAGQYRFSDFAPSLKDDYLAGRTAVIADAATDPRVPEQLRVSWATLGFQAQVGVPLVKGGRLVAVLGVDQTTPRAWTPTEIAMTEDTAERTWAAVERLRAEAEREELVVQLREADRRKDEFLATLAHELRNPLAPIRNALQVMKLSGGGEKFERSRTMIDRQLSQMVRLVDDLLDVSRITRGKMDLRRERLDLRAVIDAAVETARPLVEQAGHALTVDVPDEPVWVDGDLTRLAQVVSNLLTNSAKYTHRGGHIRLAVGRDDGVVAVAVADDGIGIPPAMLGRVFEMFTQVDRTLEKTTGGLGIGLSLVKGLVEMHGGTVEARSEGEGQGNEFVVRLPVVAGAAAPVEANGRPEQGVPAGRRRILVVDDNEDSADSMGQLLELLGNEVRTANDGEAGVAAAVEFRPDVILMDIGMPKLNGYDACRRVREQSWGRDVVLVALTGWGQDDDRRKTAEAGFDHHLVKPVEASALMTLLAGLSPDTQAAVAGAKGYTNATK